MAIVKDLYEGKQREKILAIASSLMMIAPIIAPFIGSWLLSFSDWHSIFITLTIISIVSLVGVLIIEESNNNKINKSIIQSISNLAHLMKNIKFSYYIIIFTIAFMPVFGFVGGASDIIISGFGESKFMFSIYFGINAIFAVLGPIVFIILSKKIKPNIIISLALLAQVISGIFIIYIGSYDVLLFLIMIIPGTIAIGMTRPPSMNMILEEAKDSSGAASSLMSFFIMLIATIGVLLISLEWDNRAMVYGILMLGTGLFTFILWSLFNKRIALYNRE